MRLITLTPQKARKFLEKQAKNRPVSELHVKRLAGAIKSNKWMVNGETIKFNSKGMMEDGQHRCHAVILADTQIQTYIIEGLPPGVFDTIDLGRTRNNTQLFARAGEKRYATLAAACSVLWRHDTGKLGGSWDAPRPDEAFACLEANPDIRNSVEKIHSFGVHHIMAGSLAAGLHQIFHRVSNGQSDEFFQKLGTGENLVKSQPGISAIYLLRERLRAESKERATRMKAGAIAAITIKAWNAFREKAIVKTLRWSETEDFPSIK